MQLAFGRPLGRLELTGKVSSLRIRGIDRPLLYLLPAPPLLLLLCLSSSAVLTSPHLNLIEFVCAANGSPNDTLILPVKGDECLHALAAQSMLVIIFLIWWIPPHPTLPGNEIISHFDN